MRVWTNTAGAELYPVDRRRCVFVLFALYIVLSPLYIPFLCSDLQRGGKEHLGDLLIFPCSVFGSNVGLIITFFSW